MLRFQAILVVDSEKASDSTLYIVYLFGIRLIKMFIPN